MSNSKCEIKFIRESNAIENEYSDDAFIDAMEAWKYMQSLDLPSATKFLEIHRILMKRIRPDIAGRYRACAVTIGGEIKKYRGMDFIESQLIDISNSMIESANLESIREKIDACKKTHIMFEKCHPFEDGNGRVGRIIYNWHRIQLGLPLHVIHVGSEQQKYYEWFRK